MRVKKFNEQDEVDSTALDALLEIRNDWGVSKKSAMFQTASQRRTILESSPGGVLYIIQRRKPLLRICRLQKDYWQVKNLLRTQSRRRDVAC